MESESFIKNLKPGHMYQINGYHLRLVLDVRLRCNRLNVKEVYYTFFDFNSGLVYTVPINSFRYTSMRQDFKIIVPKPIRKKLKTK